MPPLTYILMRVRDTERNLVQNHVLGEQSVVHGDKIVIGRDPACDIILDDARVPGFAIEVQHRARRRTIRMLPDGEPGCVGRWFDVGPFEIELSEVHVPALHLLPPAGLPVRFGTRRNLAAVPASALPLDPRAAEAARIAVALGDPAGHVRALDAASARWCAAQVEQYFAALSRGAAPLRPAVAQRIEYASPGTGALARWIRAWHAVEAAAFRHEAWAQLHRLDRWFGQQRAARPTEFLYAGDCCAVLGRRLSSAGLPDERAAVRGALGSLLETHLATLDDEASPLRPLAALVARGVFPLALPGAAVVLYLDSCAQPVLHSSVADENRFLHALARAPDDAELRRAYAAHLERRGEVLRAQAIRPVALGRRRIATAYELFPGASSVLLHRAEAGPVRTVPGTTADAAPRVVLEREGERIAVDGSTGIECLGKDIAIGPLGPRLHGAKLVIADGAVWISLHSSPAIVRVNGRRLRSDDAPRPVFDGDVIELERARAVTTLTAHYDGEPAPTAIAR